VLSTGQETLLKTGLNLLLKAFLKTRFKVISIAEKPSKIRKNTERACVLQDALQDLFQEPLEDVFTPVLKKGLKTVLKTQLKKVLKTGFSASPRCVRRRVQGCVRRFETK